MKQLQQMLIFVLFDSSRRHLDRHINVGFCVKCPGWRLSAQEHTTSFVQGFTNDGSVELMPWWHRLWLSLSCLRNQSLLRSVCVNFCGKNAILKILIIPIRACISLFHWPIRESISVTGPEIRAWWSTKKFCIRGWCRYACVPTCPRSACRSTRSTRLTCHPMCQVRSSILTAAYVTLQEMK